ncbi:MAG: glycine--tRNA ligase subunit beta [Acidobacteriota bacterium]|nr:glycine--tRNA ligase subunit beta [Acidobacteriota bacterium]
MAEFLFEIGLEEVPARMIAGAQAELQRRVVAMLERERLIAAGGESKSFSTPRRLAVWVAGVAERQADASEELMGPAVKIAFKDGVAGPAAMAFAKKAGVVVAALKRVDTPKGEYLAATSVKKGREAVEVIAEEMLKELAGIYWAKNMYWRPGKPERFVRPVRWMVALLGEVVVKVEFGGKTAGRATFGHRLLAGDAPIPIGFPDEYEQTLLDAKVIADVEVRRQKIRKALDRVCRATGGGLRWREDHALVDKLTHLTEWPTVIAGAFEADYLALPEEVLVTVMRDHQGYFAVEAESREQGTGHEKQGRGKREHPKLAPYFLAVLNTETDAKGEGVIRDGNERVLRARFNDARFFWEFDQRVPLTARVAQLEKVTFQKELGSYAAKSERVLAVAERLATLLAERECVVDGPALVEAVRLAKTDLTTDLVKEFTELQGEVGGLYARAQGHGERVVVAIYDQYLPKSMEDGVPRSVEGAVLALADKADTIAGMFGLGLEPTGSKDPFALRRAANGIVKILAEAEPALPLTLGDVVDAASASEAVRVRVEIFFAERLEFYLREAKGQAYDVVKAVLAAGANDVRDAVARAEAVTAVRGSEDFAAVSAAFKRMKNILAQAAEKGDLPRGVEDDASTAHPTETILTEQAGQIGRDVKELGRNYVAALETIATLRPYVDAFFDQVMIMDPDTRVRHRRLLMLRRILLTFSGIADFSEIVTAG